MDCFNEDAHPLIQGGDKRERTYQKMGLLFV